ncbi:tetratricopeptide repeat protein [Shinella sp. M31]|uniref:tetratricopeptide repeat protein n=1 Tax=Shinella sp. M31 TaxID=3368615 RepID=UPI003BA1D397
MNVHSSTPGPLKSATFEIVPMAGSDKVVIFFSATGAKPGIFNFWREGSNLPCNKIFINNGPNEWYQNGVPGLGCSIEETVTSLKRWVSHLGARHIYTCGGSMGGYAAILFGALLNARVLSFAAETQLGIEAARSVSHIHPGTPLVIPDLRPLIRESRKPISLYIGEMDPIDVYCAANLVGASNLEITTLIGVDHAPARFIRDLGLLPEFLSCLINDRAFPQLPANGSVLTMPGFPEAYLRTLQALKRSEWEIAENLGLGALDLHPTSDYGRYMVALAQHKQKKNVEALKNASLAAALARDSTDETARIKVLLAGCVRAMGDPVRASQIYTAVAEAYPDEHRAHYGKGLCHLNMKQPAEALACFEAAFAIQPSNETYRKKLAAYQR